MFSTRFSRRASAAGAFVLLLVLVGCASKDDGATVRNIGSTANGSGSASASGASGSASGPAKSGSSGSTGSTVGSGSAAAPGTAAAASEVKCQPVGNPAEATTTVAVTLTDFAIAPNVTSAPAGKINFALDNTANRAHELVVIKGSNPTQLPKTADGSFDEEAYGEDKIVGEVEAFPANSKCSGVFALEKGDYILLCNVADTEGDMKVHFAERMLLPFTVT